jgi:hypothetical protein
MRPFAEAMVSLMSWRVEAMVSLKEACSAFTGARLQSPRTISRKKDKKDQTKDQTKDQKKEKLRKLGGSLGKALGKLLQKL